MTGRTVSAVTAYSAHREWASRPPDERYASVHALYDAARARRQQLEERTIETGDFRTEAVDDDLAFRESSGRTATLTHWSFGQLATIAGGPPNYLRSLPASIASNAINYGLSRIEPAQHQLFVADTPPRTVHDIHSPRPGARPRSGRGVRQPFLPRTRPAGSWPSWTSPRPGTCRSDTRTASSAPRKFLPAPTWETETCFCSSWTATAISTIPRTAPMP